MHYRQLGTTDVNVSEISLGCNRLGESHSPDSHWIDLVRRAVDLGVNLFDTSESYGWGRSEEMIGQALGNRADVLIASKVSRVQGTNEKDLSAARIIQQAEASLRRLQRDCIEIYQLHSPSLADMQQFDWLEAMDKLKKEGKIRYAGVSINDVASGKWLIEQGLAEVLQVDYSLVAPEDGNELFPLAEEHGVGILVRMPMARGALTGKFRPGEAVNKENRASMLGDKAALYVERGEAFRPITARHAGLTLGQFALRYAISPKAVTASIPGARNLEQLTQNVGASNGMGLSTEELSEIAAIQAQWGGNG
ncbi:MAG: aldo/keto reductase [Caldilineaceae bacterium]|nr:aldo/keto reductase [Caldilineaceae bacterium]